MLFGLILTNSNSNCINCVSNARSFNIDRNGQKNGSIYLYGNAFGINIGNTTTPFYIEWIINLFGGE